MRRGAIVTGASWQSVIGLEVHAQLLTLTKLFCSCPNRYGAPANTLICPVCTGQPGVLPVVNRYAIELGIRAAVALEGNIRESSIFARKHYFYPDLPKGYQISQYEMPFCDGGCLTIVDAQGVQRKVQLKRIHFEEDAGKLLHTPEGTKVDLNRAGVPLIEIVTEPDLFAPEQAGQYLRRLRNLLRQIGVCDGNMEEGSFRCDANVSVRRVGDSELGTKVELKNLNSFRFVEKALQYEIGRQISILDRAERVIQQTRLWNVDLGTTELMRSKEQAEDYRYFPDPDLPILVISEAWRDGIAGSMPELPDVRCRRFMKEYELSAYDAGFLTGSKEMADYYESVVVACAKPKASANWVMNELNSKLNEASKEISAIPISSEGLGELICMVENGEISGKVAKSVFESMWQSGKTAREIVKQAGLAQISDKDMLARVAQKVILAYPEQVKSYRAGKTGLLGFFVGNAMKETQGQGNPVLLSELMKKLLGDIEHES